MKGVLVLTPEVKLVRSLPGAGFILATVIALEVGDVRRFPRPAHLASYAGTVPMVQQSGDKVWHGKTQEDVNRYLKWAYAEAANALARHAQKNPHRHVRCLYLRIQERKGRQKAVGAVSRHLAEATWWVLVTQQPYREPMYRSRGGVMEA
ncbi:MAG: IS110 family transposase [Candidatus Hadarchaeum sp.]|uniref:IS110 family transposase n=1 Tax=Candidatus Hadarchaeum sp. TaxID=2883567 RepID=UPI003175CC4E